MLKTLLAVTCLMASMASWSATVTIDMLGTDWDVSTVEGTWAEHELLLKEQAWYGRFKAALVVSFILGDALGYPNGDGAQAYAPVVAIWGGGGNVSYAATPGGLDNGSDTTSRVYAIATPSGVPFPIFPIATPSPVPLPAAAWLFISAIAGLAGAKRLSRSKGSA
jgi:hypothetical protein